MIKTVSRRAALLASLFLPLCGTLAVAPAQAEPLSLAVSAPPASIDPHYYTLTPSIMLSSHIFSRLVQRDEKSRVVPDLAESWKLVDDTTWEFKLRPGVKFHNGADFTAEDVAYSLERVPTVQSPSSFSVYTRDIADVQVVDVDLADVGVAAPDHDLLRVRRDQTSVDGVAPRIVGCHGDSAPSLKV